MDLSRALSKVRDEIDNLYHLENDMTAIKKPTAVKKPATKAADETVKKPATKAADETVKKPATKKEPAAEKVSRPRGTPEGHIGLKELAEETGLKPGALRRKLRSLENITKPEGQHGWVWKEGSRDLAAVRKALAKAE